MRSSTGSTLEGPFGEIVDWVDPHELSPLYGIPATPPKTPAPPAEGPIADPAVAGESPPSADAQFGADLSLLWAEQYKQAPANTVPVIRPNFRVYVEGETAAKSLTDYIAALPQPQPAGQTRLYAAKQQTITNTGTEGWIHYHNFAQVSSAGMSLVQLAALCPTATPNTTMEAVEFGIQESQSLYGDANLHMFTYFRTAGTATGNLVGGYNQTVTGFVPCTGATCTASGGPGFPPGAVVPDPGANGAHRRLTAQLGCVGQNCSIPAWWVQDYLSPTAWTWLGWYPVGTGAGQIPFDLINASSCRVDWYGEAFDPTPTGWDNTDMGNGLLGASNASAATMHGMRVFTNGGSQFFSTGAVNGGPVDANCYSTSTVFSSNTANWERWFRFGGPGGDGAGCD